MSTAIRVGVLGARGLDLSWAQYVGDDRAVIAAVLERTFASGDVVKRRVCVFRPASTAFTIGAENMMGRSGMVLFPPRRRAMIQAQCGLHHDPVFSARRFEAPGDRFHPFG